MILNEFFNNNQFENKSFGNPEPEQQQMDADRRGRLGRERNAGLDEPDDAVSGSVQTGNGVYEYTVPAGQESTAQELGLQQHRGHWVSRVPIQRANFQFGRPQFHEIPSPGVAEGVRDLGYDAQSLIMKLRRDVEEKRLQPTPQAVLAAARELAGDMEFAPQLLVKQVLGQGVAEGLEQPKEAFQAIQKLQRFAQDNPDFTLQQLDNLPSRGNPIKPMFANANLAIDTLIQAYKTRKELGNAEFLKQLKDEINYFLTDRTASQDPTTLGDLLQGKLGKINFQQRVAEGSEYKSRHAHKQEQDKAYADYRTKHATSSMALMTRAEFAKDQRERAAKKKQGVAEGSSTMWEVSFDYGPHQSETVKVKARSAQEAVDKVETAAEKKGRSIMVNWARPAEQSVAEAIPDVDHMHGPRGINLPVADTRDILQKPFEFYGNYKEWAHDVDRVNSELLDDNAEYTSMAGGKTISINGKDFAFWSNRNGNGSIDVGIAKKHSGQGITEGGFKNLYAEFSGYGNYMQGRAVNVFTKAGLEIVSKEYSEDDDIQTYVVKGDRQSIEKAGEFLERNPEQFGGYHFVKQGVSENYPKHQDLSGVSTDKLKAYVAKQSQQSVPGEGSQVKRVRAELQRRSQGVAEGSNDTIYPNAEVIKSRNGRPVGEIYQDENGWGFFHYRMDGGNDFIDSREDAIEGLRDLHQETVRSRPDYTIKGVAEGSESPELELERLKLRQDAEHGRASLKRQSETQARIRKLEKQIKDKQGVAEGSKNSRNDDHDRLATGTNESRLAKRALMHKILKG